MRFSHQTRLFFIFLTYKSCIVMLFMSGPCSYINWATQLTLNKAINIPQFRIGVQIGLIILTNYFLWKLLIFFCYFNLVAPFLFPHPITVKCDLVVLFLLFVAVSPHLFCYVFILNVYEMKCNSKLINIGSSKETKWINIWMNLLCFIDGRVDYRCCSHFVLLLFSSRL